jgi:hypothetical protein
MLILDIKTRWSSTHQMLRKYSSIIDDQVPIKFTGCALDTERLSMTLWQRHMNYNNMSFLMTIGKQLN